MGSGGSKPKRKQKAVSGQQEENAAENAQLGQDEGSGVTPSGQNSTAEEPGDPAAAAVAAAADQKQQSLEDQTATVMGDEYVEAVVAKASEFGDNE